MNFLCRWRWETLLVNCFMYEEDKQVKNYINHNCQDELSVKLLVNIGKTNPQRKRHTISCWAHYKSEKWKKVECLLPWRTASIPTFMSFSNFHNTSWFQATTKRFQPFHENWSSTSFFLPTRVVRKSANLKSFPSQNHRFHLDDKGGPELLLNILSLFLFFFALNWIYHKFLIST